MRRKKLSNKQKDYITLSTILMFFALITYVMIIAINYLVKWITPLIF